MLTVGLTGGIGTGKSICASIFHSLGIPIYESDQQAKRLMSHDDEVRTSLVEAFGKDVYDAKGQLDRKKLASIVFNDSSQLARINSIVHPAVRRDFINWTKAHEHYPYIIQESALVFEIGLNKFYDKVIVVDAPKELRIDRVIRRDQSSREQVLSRMSKQLPQEEKVLQADFVIQNDGEQSIIQQVLTIHITLLKEIKH